MSNSVSDGSRFSAGGIVAWIGAFGVVWHAEPRKVKASVAADTAKATAARWGMKRKMRVVIMN
jgi:hypothetical protein